MVGKLGDAKRNRTASVYDLTATPEPEGHLRGYTSEKGKKPP